MSELAALVVLAALSAANGANDVSKGVATLAGSGVTRYRTALLWGAATTLAGSLLSGALAGKMLRLFSAGIVSAPATPAFTLAVLCGTAGWIALATLARLPVSTTHALIGSLVGAGTLYAPRAVAWTSLLPRLALPLSASIAAAYGLSTLLNRFLAGRAAGACVCVGTEALAAGAFQVAQPAVVAGRVEECATVRGLRFDGNSLHWLSSGLVGFARGLNDTPKLVAAGSALLGSRLGPTGLAVLVSAAMLAGSVAAGRRVARVLGEKVVPMNDREGLMANVTTALLVGPGAMLGLPMSTTHVSTSAIAGIAGADRSRLNRRTVRDLVLAWTVTPLVAGGIAAVVWLGLTSY